MLIGNVAPGLGRAGVVGLDEGVNRDYGSGRHDPPLTRTSGRSHRPQIRPLAGQRALEEGEHALAAVLDDVPEALLDKTVLDRSEIDVLEALSDKAVLDRTEILSRLVSELAQPIKVALPLFLSKAVPIISQAVPATRDVLTGLGQHGPEVRDRCHVLCGLSGEPFAVLSGEAQRARELIGGILEAL